MQAEDILTATHKLETSGMTRPQSEAIANTIIADPLATKADLESLATKADLESLATKADLESLATKADLEPMKEQMKEQMATKTDVETMNTKIESTKVWLLGGLLAVSMSILALAFT